MSPWHRERPCARPRGRRLAVRRVVRSALVLLPVLGIALALVSAAATHDLWTRVVRAGEPYVVRVTMTPRALDPALVILRPGAVRFDVRNDAATPRRFFVEGPETAAGTDVLPPGASARLIVTLSRRGRYRLRSAAPDGDAPSSATLEVRP